MTPSDICNRIFERLDENKDGKCLFFLSQINSYLFETKDQNMYYLGVKRYYHAKSIH